MVPDFDAIDATFAPRLLDWFDVAGRKDLPWQRNISPYRVWVSEIMLQQTQVATVISFYERFMTRFPTVEDLASAQEDEVLHLWTGLGYYARARNLLKSARVVVSELGGQFPSDVDGLVALPGIGRSTAGAIVSIAFKQRAPILDGNVKRVLARHFAVPGWPGESATAKTLWQIAERTTPSERVADYTQAIMDLGATLCTRSKPQCDQCPLGTTCLARSEGQQAAFPGKRKRSPMPERSTVFVIARHGQQVFLERRPDNGIWGGLWCFPQLPDQEAVDDWCTQTLGTTLICTGLTTPFRHTFSHFHLHIQPVVVDVNSPQDHIADNDRQRWVEISDPGSLGLPRPVARLFDKLADIGTTKTGEIS